MVDLKNTYIKNDQGELRDLYLSEAKKQGIDVNCNITRYFLLYRPRSSKSIDAARKGWEDKENNSELTLEDFKRHEYEKGTRKALKEIAQIFGKTYGVDVGYQNLPTVVICCKTAIDTALRLSRDENKALTDEMNKIAKACDVTIGEDISYQYLSEFIVNKINKQKQPKTKTHIEWEQVPCTDAAHWFEQNETLYCAPSDERTPYGSIQDYINNLANGDVNILFRKVEKEIDWWEEVGKFLDDNEAELGFSDWSVSDVDLTNEKFIELCRLVVGIVGGEND